MENVRLRHVEGMPRMEGRGHTVEYKNVYAFEQCPKQFYRTRKE